MSFLAYFFSLVPSTILPAEVKKPAAGASPASSCFKPRCHPLVIPVTGEVDEYFLQHWIFHSVKTKKKFVDAGFSRVTCYFSPKALNDRIHFAYRLLTVLFLIDDALEYMSSDEGSAYNERLIPISRGDVLPDCSVPVEYIIYDSCLYRLTPSKLLSALMRYSMGLRVTDTELEIARPAELNCSRHISVLNDMYNFEKEVVAAKEGHQEGGKLCTSVQIMAAKSGATGGE